MKQISDIVPSLSSRSRVLPSRIIFGQRHGLSLDLSSRRSTTHCTGESLTYDCGVNKSIGSQLSALLGDPLSLGMNTTMNWVPAKHQITLIIRCPF